MTPKDRRNILFKDFKPNIRPFTNENGEISPDDQKYLYAAYKQNGGELNDPEEVLKEVLSNVSEFDMLFFIDDKSKQFKKGYGVIGMMAVMYNGWEFQPHIEWMPWTTKKGMLRGIVGAAIYCRYSKDIGITLIKCLENDRAFFKRLKKYAPVYGDYKIPHGDHRGDQYIYYIRGKKDVIR